MWNTALAVIGLSVASSWAMAQAAENFQQPSERGTLQVEYLVTDLQHPWGLAFLPDGQALISERPGTLRLVASDFSATRKVEGVPKVFSRGQGGLLDVALSPQFVEDRLVYLAFAEAGDDGLAGTAVGRGQLAADNSRLEHFQVIFRQQPKLSTGNHFGSRLVFDDQGHLFITLGENYQRAAAQDLGKLQGKVVRLNADGSVPKDNPFVGKTGARSEIWSYGHRNAQGAALNPWTDALWVHEHGPRGGDEINIPQAGKNYGWPLATHGVDYTLLPISEALGKSAPGTEPPHHVWEKSPAISGMAFYNAERFAGWQHNLFIGALADQSLIRLELQGNEIVHEERLLSDRLGRIRDVRQGPDGYLYLLTDAAAGSLVRIGLTN
ncbi:glucose/arabinose dehydrogenase [Pseudomonas sp. TE3786]